MVRGFARWLQAYDPATEMPPTGWLHPSRRRIPYLYSQDDITALLAAARQTRRPLSAATYETLIGLVAVTGMRSGEAVRLDRADVALDKGLITIWDSKFGKSRQLPLHPSTVTALRDYSRRRDSLSPAPQEAAFFVHPPREPDQPVQRADHVPCLGPSGWARGTLAALSSHNAWAPAHLRGQHPPPVAPRRCRCSSPAPTVVDLAGARRSEVDLLVPVGLSGTARRGGSPVGLTDREAVMTEVTPTLQAFFTQRLIGQRQASAHTVASYRDTFRLLLGYLAKTTSKAPAELDFEDLDAATISAFLTHLERDRGVSVATRNARLAAIRSLFTFAAYRHPEHADLIAQVLAIPSKRRDRPVVTFLTAPEIDAFLAAPDSEHRTGRRDHALLCLAVQTGLRVSELARLCHKDVHLGRGAHVRVHGKGRKERLTPLTNHTVTAIQPWLDETRTAGPEDPVFPGPAGRPLTRDAIRKLVIKHAGTAALRCPTMASKRVGVHTLRHSCAMNLLAVGTDLATIALWLGHEDIRTVQGYLHADLTLKEKALARTTPHRQTPLPSSRPAARLPGRPVIMQNPVASPWCTSLPDKRSHAPAATASA
jgi:site-specific recombinase XerD